jgi:uncharacterized protein YgiM (DUF1202 family)
VNFDECQSGRGRGDETLMPICILTLEVNLTKRITIMFLVLALAVGFYAMTVKTKGDGTKADPTQPAQPSQTAESVDPGTCHVFTGVDGGTVNLRTCAGTSCAVLDIVAEGESLDIVRAGAWANVTTEDGVTGFINFTYCKKEK